MIDVSLPSQSARQHLPTAFAPAPSSPFRYLVTVSSRSTLLLGFDPRTTLAVARSLHRQGIPVIVGTIARWERPLRSRAIRAFVPLPGPDRPDGEFLRTVWRVIDEYDVDTIIPVNDRALLLLAPHHAELSARVRLACPEPSQIASVLHKDTTAALAVRLGIPVPVEVKSTMWPDLEAQAASLKFPLVAKSRDRTESSCHSRIADPRFRHFDCFETMRDVLAEAGGCGPGLLVQEYFPGDDVGLAVLMHDGNALVVFQYRARRTFPSPGGVCVLAQTEKVDPRLGDAAVRLLRELRWQGVAQLDFRHDPATGRFALLEINGRFWGSTAVAIAAGLDFPHHVWQLAHGRVPQVPSSYRTGLLVRWMEGDFRRLCELRWARGRVDPGRSSFGREVWRFVAGFRPGVRDMFWSWRDPVPFFDNLTNFVRWWLVARCTSLGVRLGLLTEIQPVRDGVKS